MTRVTSENRVPLDAELVVRNRYSRAANTVEQSLCCPVAYDPRWLTAIPRAVLERDYGCGDPSRHVRAGETVLDLGSGSGKICFIASQVVGPTGSVIGVDVNSDMLRLARESASEVAGRIGYANVQFRRGRIQDLALDLDLATDYLSQKPVFDADGLTRLDTELDRLRAEAPLVAADTIDVVVSNCVLNLVNAAGKRQLFGEIFRVLRRGGRAIISDIVSDEDVPQRMREDPELWSGCISGALREDRLLAAFEDAGFFGISLVERQSKPWRTIEGIEFRSVTIAAYKGKEGPCLDRNQAVIYRGPFREVVDDDGHVLRRGARAAVCAKTFEIYSRDPYRTHFELVPPLVPVPPDEAQPFSCDGRDPLWDPRRTKGANYDVTTEAVGCRSDEGCC